MLDPLLARTLAPKQIEYIDNTGWGVKPLDGNSVGLIWNVQKLIVFFKLVNHGII